jgi:hypothetical protein
VLTCRGLTRTNLHQQYAVCTYLVHVHCGSVRSDCLFMLMQASPKGLWQSIFGRDQDGAAKKVL